MIKNIIFDLDGTLIDSADSILDSLSYAFDFYMLRPKKQLTKNIIGPPLGEILRNLVDPGDIGKISQLECLFKTHYDNESFRKTTVFSGVDETLAKLVEKGHALYVATNKRIEPSLKIIDYLGWSGLFINILSLNSFEEEACASKADLLERMLMTLNLSVSTTIYVGDRIEDSFAAEVNKISFILADWGYGDVKKNRDGIKGNIASYPSELFFYI